MHSLAPRGTSGERVWERGDLFKPSSSPRPSPPPSSEEREKAASVSDADFLNSIIVWRAAERGIQVPPCPLAFAVVNGANIDALFPTEDIVFIRALIGRNINVDLAVGP